MRCLLSVFRKRCAMPRSSAPRPARPSPPDERAQRIRDLVGVARGCIIEIGRELIKAKAEVGHGKWLPWLDAEFGWSQPTASRFMQVAEAFKSFSVNSLAGLTIDATALYARCRGDPLLGPA
jgi:hypothetical protein